MKRNLFYATWYTLWLTGVVFAATIVVVMQKTQMIKLAVVSVLAILQIIGLAYYLHRPPNRQEPLLLKCLLRLLQFSAVGVLAFLVVCIYALGNSYHNDLPTIADDTENSNITIAETEDLYILYPNIKPSSLKLSIDLTEAIPILPSARPRHFKNAIPSAFRPRR